MGLDGRVLEVPFVRFYLYLHSKITFANLQNREIENLTRRVEDYNNENAIFLGVLGTEQRHFKV